MAESSVTAEGNASTWKKTVRQLGIDTVGRVARRLRRRWTKVHILPEKIDITENPKYKSETTGSYKLVKTYAESGAAEYLARAEDGIKASGRGDELKRALRNLAMRPNSLVLIRGLNYQ